MPLPGAVVSGEPGMTVTKFGKESIAGAPFPDARFVELDGGRYVAQGLLRGPVTISASAKGYLGSAERTVTIDRPLVTSTLRLRRGAQLQVRVVDAETLSPIDGAFVATRSVGGVGSTAADGTLSETLEPGPYQLIVQADGHVTTTLNARLPLAQTLLVTMSRAGGIALTVHQPDGGAAPDAHATIEDEDV